MEVSLSKFIKLKPHSFSRSDVLEDPLCFLNSMERVFKAFSCFSIRSVKLASFKLENVAQLWFDSFI